MQKVNRFFGKIKDFLKAHEDIRQLVMFTLFSLVCFAIEYISFIILELTLARSDEPFKWFIFSYESGGSGEFIAFLVSNVLAQIATFFLNRKKTFHADNNIVYAGTMYAVMVCGIILLNTWLGGVVSDAVVKGSALPQSVAGLVGKLVGSVLSFVISFLMSKFVIMRKAKKHTDETEAADAAIAAGAIPEEADGAEEI